VHALGGLVGHLGLELERYVRNELIVQQLLFTSDRNRSISWESILCLMEWKNVLRTS
jgi:hypothetical protein